MSSCPISFVFVDENGARVSAVFVLILLAAALTFQSGWIALAVGADFVLKAISPRLSPLSRLAKLLLIAARVPSRSVNAGPKIFAAKIGAVAMAVIAAGLFAGWEIATLVSAAVLAVCAFLEAAFGYCVGCTIYGFLTGMVAPSTPPDDYSI